jgi:hypothetical protein
MRRTVFPLILTAGSILVSCDQTPPHKVPEPTNQLETQINSLKTQLDDLQKSVTGLQFELNTVKNRYQSVILDTSAKEFQRLDTSYGFFLVSLKNVASYADGYKLTLDIGNPSAAQYSGFTINAKWGQAFDPAKDYSSWEQSLHEKKFTYTDTLHPSSWNTVYLFLTPAQKEDLGYIEVSLEANVVSLQVR